MQTFNSLPDTEKEHLKLRPFQYSYNTKTNKSRDLTKLFGICEGVISDGSINDKERSFIKNWIAVYGLENEPIPHKILELFNISQEQELIASLRQILGEIIVTLDGDLIGLTGDIDYDHPETIDFKNKNFLFSGTFALIEKKAIIDFIVLKGGIPKIKKGEQRVTKDIDYLIVGTVASRDYSNGSVGNKIIAALEQREKRPIQIIHEKWYVEKIHGQ